MKTDKVGNYEVSSDGETVWVNGILGCVARFGSTGYDWNNGFTVGAVSGAKVTRKVIRNSDGTFEGTARETTPQDWTSFVGMVEKMFKISLSNSHRPIRLS